MDSRRCQSPTPPNGQPIEAGGPSGAASLLSLTQTDELFELIASSQSRRLDDQRASVGDCLTLRIAQDNVAHLCETCNPQQPSDDFFNMLIRYQSCRLNDQRCSLPEPLPAPDPDEDFFSLIQRVQAKRMDEQRVSFYSPDHEDTDCEPQTKPSSSDSS